ncbi:hypothetical protein AYO44_04600 [Planctomycetaceae bacterium SCGC AG-212-F19]|nr:hypothetical protein AYO44_04600 [Planctomycetaceae bacterium SCGC AG-212-F19]
MKTYFLLAVGVACVGVASVCWARAEQKDDLQALMRKKLQSSQQVLEGLALNDFDKISKHAGELIRISQAGEFRVLKTAQYELYSNQFRRSVETMDEMARGKNGDGAALAYVEMTLTCVKCHKHVREVRMASR